jgi:hypothetical protein
MDDTPGDDLRDERTAAGTGSRGGRHDFRVRYVRRVVDEVLDGLLPALPAVLLDGPKAVGKTATALQRSTTVWRLSRPAQASVVSADPQQALDGPPPVLLDEYQRVPALFDAVREAVDEDSAPGRFLLTGSAPPPGSHSGAGRITTVRMRPLTLPERGASTPTVSLASLFEGSFDAPVAGSCPSAWPTTPTWSCPRACPVCNTCTACRCRSSSTATWSASSNGT